MSSVRKRESQYRTIAGNRFSSADKPPSNSGRSTGNGNGIDVVVGARAKISFVLHVFATAYIHRRDLRFPAISGYDHTAHRQKRSCLLSRRSLFRRRFTHPTPQKRSEKVAYEVSQPSSIDFLDVIFHHATSGRTEAIAQRRARDRRFNSPYYPSMLCWRR